MNKIRIGTRGSKLALKQAALVQEALQQAQDGIETEIVLIHTQGDRILDKPLAEIGDKGVFVSEFEQALTKGQIDIAVHSAKDLPMKLAQGLFIAAVLPRGDVRDVLVVPKGGRLPKAAEECSGKSGSVLYETAAKEQQRTGDIYVIGTGSRRRQQQAEQLWEHVTCESIRGNVDTRLNRLKESSRAVRSGSECGKAEYGGTVYNGIILAKAGLDRLDVISQYGEEYDFYPLSPERFLPAACQGIIAVEAAEDSMAAGLCRKITDAETKLCFLTEREVLTQLAADCSESAAAWCRQEQGNLILDVMYARNRVSISCETGSRMKERREGREAMWEEKGLELARKAAKLVKEQGGL